MLRTLIIGIGAGLVTAIAFASATTGPPLAQFFLFLISPLPLYLAGLGLGWRGALLSGMAGSVLIGLVAGPVSTLVFGATHFLPATVLTWLAGLRRDGGGVTEFYPVGRMVAWSAGMAAAAVVGLLLIAGQDLDVLRGELRKAAEEFIKTQMPRQPDGATGTIPEADLEQMTSVFMALMPPVAAMLLMGAQLFNLWIAGRVALASGVLGRPWPDLAAVQLPAGAALGLAVSLIGAAVLPGLAALCSAAIAGALYFAYMLVGLAILHHVTRGNPWRGMLLWALYVMLMFLNSIVSPLLVMLGLAEPISPVRRDFTRGPPSPPGGPPSGNV